MQLNKWNEWWFGSLDDAGFGNGQLVSDLVVSMVGWQAGGR